jgi:hypothetical protein
MAKINVLIIESSAAKDFYSDQLDGPATLQLLKVLNLEVKLRYAINKNIFKLALREAAEGNYNIVHISCHGTTEGLILADKSKPTWKELADVFQNYELKLDALVMSSCCGASSGIGNAFEKVKVRPNIIFGSTDSRYYDEYAVAWAILYRTFLNKKVTRDAAQDALAHITAVVEPSFRYRRWDDEKKRYLCYPGQSSKFGVIDLSQLTRKEREKIDVI